MPDPSNVPRNEVKVGAAGGRASTDGIVGPNLSSPIPMLLLTIPARNEAIRLGASVDALREVIRDPRYTGILSVAEDGSTDGTKRLLTELQRRDPALLAVSEEGDLGRGLALKRLWMKVPADVYLFVDADLAMGTEAVRAAIEHLLSGDEVITGSRYCAGARVTRPPVRNMISRGYNWLVRLWFRDRVRDHQCGLKGFAGRVARELLPYTTESSWFWDTEILVLSAAAGYEIHEIPVVWSERKASRTELRRLFSDFYLHGSGLLRLVGTVGQKSRALRDQLARSRSAVPRPGVGTPEFRKPS